MMARVLTVSNKAECAKARWKKCRNLPRIKSAKVNMKNTNKMPITAKISLMDFFRNDGGSAIANML